MSYTALKTAFRIVAPAFGVASVVFLMANAFKDSNALTYALITFFGFLALRYAQHRNRLSLRH